MSWFALSCCDRYQGSVQLGEERVDLSLHSKVIVHALKQGPQRNATY